MCAKVGTREKLLSLPNQKKKKLPKSKQTGDGIQTGPERGMISRGGRTPMCGTNRPVMWYKIVKTGYYLIAVESRKK